MTENMDTEEIIAFAKTRLELPWQWGIFLDNKETEAFAKENNMELEWYTPIRPGDLYLAKRNTGYKLLTCRRLGEACVHPVELEYPFDFSECVKVKLS